MFELMLSSLPAFLIGLNPPTREITSTHNSPPTWSPTTVRQAWPALNTPAACKPLLQRYSSVAKVPDPGWPESSFILLLHTFCRTLFCLCLILCFATHPQTW